MKEISQKKELNERVCTVAHLKYVDNLFRRLIHNPRKLFDQYVKQGMRVMDLGCGGGFVTIAFANMVGEKGKVVAADLQQEMLNITRDRVEKNGLSPRVTYHKCNADSINLKDSLDFILAFFMVHEAPSIENLLKEIFTLLKPGGVFYASEPSFHVTPRDFKDMQDIAEKIGFSVLEYPKVRLARSVVFKK
ncbi:MAG: class I SAM-dependent methyltransferase [Acidobacteria bacterium]|nr:class I SAM-dependent methyltransferase [Acidobacteriota bacterium]